MLETVYTFMELDEEGRYLNLVGVVWFGLV